MISIFCERVGAVWYSGALTKSGKLIACSFSPRNGREALRSVLDSIPKGMRGQGWKRTNRHAFAKRLHALFTGKRNARRPPIDLSHETNFERRVYTLISKIPRGYVMTYGGAARAVESKRHARAVGGAMASNPLPLIVPCHRIVRSTLSVGNYGLGHYPSKIGTSIKREILRREGVRFKDDRISRESLWKPRTG